MTERRQQARAGEVAPTCARECEFSAAAKALLAGLVVVNVLTVVLLIIKG